MAALNGHAATTEVLLQRGFQIDFLGLLTTLQAACIGGNEEIVHGLLIFHSDSQKFSYEYQSAIILAVENSHWRIALHRMQPSSCSPFRTQIFSGREHFLSMLASLGSRVDKKKRYMLMYYSVSPYYYFRHYMAQAK